MKEVTINKIIKILNANINKAEVTSLQMEANAMLLENDTVCPNELEYTPEKETVITNKQIDEDLTKLGMDSLTFIQIVVSLEDEFECEIPDSKLLLSELNTVNKIYSVLLTIESEPSNYADNNKNM